MNPSSNPVTNPASEPSAGASKRLKVVCPVTTRDGRTFWLNMGGAYPNRDGSTNVYLDALPVNGKLQIREADDPPWKARAAETEAKTETLPF